MEGGAYMYHVECIDIHKTDKMYLYIDRACLCANNMYNVANFHIRNLMTGLKKDLSLRTENERSVIRTFAVSIPRLTAVAYGVLDDMGMEGPVIRVLRISEHGIE